MLKNYISMFSLILYYSSGQKMPVLFCFSDNNQSTGLQDLEVLDSRKLTNEERDSLEGEISRAELKSQLFKHMKPSSAPGIDGFTVA